MAYTTIDDPSKHFNTILWTGDGDTASNKTGTGFKPDLTWIKKRTDDVEDHALFDSTLGLGGKLRNPNGLAIQETAGNNGYISAFLDDGFSVATNGSDSAKWAYLNESSDTFVAWNWKANGGTTSSNSDGSLTSTVQVNSDAGFSMVKYTPAGANATVGHGLGVAPNLIIVNGVTTANNWRVGSDALTSWVYRINLESQGAESSQANVWNSTAPTSSVFSIGTSSSVSDNGVEHTAYCFRDVKGFSKFGNYTGNASADGPFVYLGFKPAFLLLKRLANTDKWFTWDNKRATSNVIDNVIEMNEVGVENTDPAFYMDFVSNGFKLRNTFGALNASGEKYLYLAFAENPYVTSTGLPTTAR